MSGREYICQFQTQEKLIWAFCQLDEHVNGFEDIKQYFEALKSWNKIDKYIYICKINYLGSRREFNR